jgi:predicted acyl esterase
MAAVGGTRQTVRAVLVTTVVGGLALLGLPGSPSTPAAAGAVATFTVQGSVEQVAVTGLDVGDEVTLEHAGDDVAEGTADAQGAHLFRGVAPGTGYTVTDGLGTSGPVTVTSPAVVPPQSLYDGQTIEASPIGLTLEPLAVTHSGTFGYIETRDGTTLAALASLPYGAQPGDGPFPVVVEYSGYAPSDPHAGTPSPTQLAANVSGYAWVGVNMRGTACSGGAFDYFEALQSLDGYDVIEAVAAQDWVDSDGVGMIGISYPGNSQLFVAGTRPPSLSAVAPLSVVADTYRSTLYPGGILNDGFAAGWAADRDAAGEPAAEAYAQDRIADGDDTCEANQALRLQQNRIVPRLDPAAFYEVALGDSLNPTTFVDDVDIPVFLAGTFQDEQTGGHWPTLIDDFAAADPLRVVMTNGSHTDPLGPLVAPDLLDFFDLYLKRESPSSAAAIAFVGPTLYEEIYGASGLEMRPRDWGSMTYAQALAQYESEPNIRVLWENGATDAVGECVDPSAPATCAAQWPYPSSTSTYSSWPPPSTQPWALRLLPDGRLGVTGAAGLAADEPRAVASYEYDPSQGSSTSYSGGSSAIWRTDATYEWEPAADGTSLSFLTQPMTTERRLLGSASVDLWVRASAPDVDLEVNLTEVTPEGDEVYIQSGWLRASHRATTDDSTTLLPVHSHLPADAAPLPADELSLARVEVFPFAHVLRPGSRLRLTVESPGGDRPFWTFESVDAPDGTTVDLSLSDVQPSQVVLPFVGGDAPNQRPACGSLRSQPCRDFDASAAPTGVTLVATGEDSADVSWTAPEGGGTVTGYEVTLEPGGVTESVAAGTTTASFSGLAPGDYTATVVATFAGGDGPPSAPSLLETVPLCAPFSDVGRNHPFCRDIAWMDAEGISTGFPDGTYRPSASVTRQAMSAFLYRLAGEPAFTPPATASFRDVSPSHPFFAEIEWMAEEGISTGFSDGTYRPGPAVSRQAMSAFLARVAGVPNPPAPAEATFTDVSPSHPFFAEVEWMAAEQISTGYQPGSTYRPSVAVSRQAMSAFLHRLADGPGVNL